MKNLVDKIKKLELRKKIFWVLTIACMITIFIFSSKDADASTKDSHEIGKMVGYVTIYDFDRWTEDAQERYAAKIDHPVRKTAHFLEYMLLGQLITAAWYDNKKKRSSNMGVPVIIGAAYAVTDEIHQLVVSGRAGMFTDVLLDSAGVVAGMLLMSLLIRIGRMIMDGHT